MPLQAPPDTMTSILNRAVPGRAPYRVNMVPARSPLNSDRVYQFDKWYGHRPIKANAAGLRSDDANPSKKKSPIRRSLLSSA